MATIKGSAALVGSSGSIQTKPEKGIEPMTDTTQGLEARARELNERCEETLSYDCEASCGICSRCLILAALKAEREAATLAERERAIAVVQAFLDSYPLNIFTDPEPGKHGETVDACSARALRRILPIIAAAIREGRDE